MNTIEIDHDVSKKLAVLAGRHGITKNAVLRRLLRINKINVSHSTTTDSIESIPKHPPEPDFNNNVQEELIPHILEVIYKNGGSATKTFVENEIFNKFRYEFSKPYYNQNVSHGVLRWKHHIAWAKERARQLHEYIKSPDESGRGIWELTNKGIVFCKHQLA